MKYMYCTFNGGSWEQEWDVSSIGLSYTNICESVDVSNNVSQALLENEYLNCLHLFLRIVVRKIEDGLKLDDAVGWRDIIIIIIMIIKDASCAELLTYFEASVSSS